MWKSQVFCRFNLQPLRYMATALRFREAYKIRNSNQVYYRKHLSKSRKRILVSGGKKLKDSGIYTPKFCGAVIDSWLKARASGMEAVTYPQHFSDHRALWKISFQHSPREEEPCFLLRQLYFSMALSWENSNPLENFVEQTHVPRNQLASTRSTALWTFSLLQLQRSERSRADHTWRKSQLSSE